MAVTNEPRAPQAPWLKEVEGVLERAWGEGRKQLFEHEVYEILSSLGIRTPSHVFVRDEREITRGILGMLGSCRVILRPGEREPPRLQGERGLRPRHLLQ